MPSWTYYMHIMQKEIADMTEWKNVSLPRRRHRFDYCHPQSSNSCAKKLMAIISLNLTTWFATSLHLAYQFIVSFSINFGSFQFFFFFIQLPSFQFLNPRYLPSFFWPHPLTKYLLHQYKNCTFLANHQQFCFGKSANTSKYETFQIYEEQREKREEIHEACHGARGRNEA